jgi:large subunit ribosomal protein L25
MEIHAHTRNDETGSETRKIREEGNIPAVLYGSNIESEKLYVDSVEFEKLYKQVGQHGLFTLVNSDVHHSVMVHETQRDPLKNEYVHVDFFEVDMNKEVNAEIPIHFIGEPDGAKDCTVQHSLRQLSVRTLPEQLPESIDVNLSALSVGDSLQIRDLENQVPYDLQHDAEEVVVSVLPPRTYEDQPDSESDVVSEPDLVDGPDEVRVD